MEQQKSSFLANFCLLDKSKKYIPPKCSQLNLIEGSPEKLRRLPRKNRSTLTLGKCNTIPLSSPAGQFLIKSTRTVMSDDYQLERLDRLERFCHAPPLVVDDDGEVHYPKWFNKTRPSVNVTFKRSGPKQPYHQYKFPRRQFYSSSKESNFLFYNSLLIKRCKPFTINVERLNMNQVCQKN